MSEAQACLAAARRTAKKESYNNFRTWAFRAVSKGAGAAHTWTKKGPDTKHLILVGYDDEGAFVADPIGMMETRRSFWSSLWRKEASFEGDRNELLSVLGLIRAAALEHAQELGRLTGVDVAKATARLSNKATRWADSWTHAELKHIVSNSAEGRSELAEVYNTAELNGALPHQAAIATVGLVSKPGSSSLVSAGERPICIFSSFFQLWGC